MKPNRPKLFGSDYPKSFVVISLRRPAEDGAGDSRRAWQLIQSLKTKHHVREIWVLESSASLLGALLRPMNFARMARLMVRHARTKPVQWVIAQAVMGNRPIEESFPVYVLSRAVPDPLPARFGVDFVDSMATNARTRAQSVGTLQSIIWRRESGLTKKWESRVAACALASTAVSRIEAEAIGDDVRTIPLVAQWNEPTGLELPPLPAVHRWLGQQRRLLFAGSLFYKPNHEAAMWLVRELMPRLVGEYGMEPSGMLIAGRRPRHSLVRAVSQAGCCLAVDVPSLAALFSRATVSLAPMTLGGGVQNKILESLAVGCPTVLTPHANAGLNMAESPWVSIADRTPEDFVAAIETLDRAEPTRRELSTQRTFYESLNVWKKESVIEQWLALYEETLCGQADPDSSGDWNSRC